MKASEWLMSLAGNATHRFGLRLSDGTVVYSPELSNIHPSVDIGKGSKIHSHVWIGEGVTIGENCRVQAFTFIPSGVKVGNNVFLGPRVTFTNDKHPPSGGKDWSETVVEDGAVIGAGAVILPGLVIGRGAVVGAGSVVTKSVPAGKTVYGNPARQKPEILGVPFDV